MEKATQTIVLYTDTEIIAEVYEGEIYMIPENVKVFMGDLEEFKKNNNNYSLYEDVEIISEIEEK